MSYHLCLKEAFHRPKDQHLCSSIFWCLAIHHPLCLPLCLARYSGIQFFDGQSLHGAVKFGSMHRILINFALLILFKVTALIYERNGCLKSYHLIFSLEYIFSYWWSYRWQFHNRKECALSLNGKFWQGQALLMLLKIPKLFEHLYQATKFQFW